MIKPNSLNNKFKISWVSLAETHHDKTYNFLCAKGFKLYII